MFNSAVSNFMNLSFKVESRVSTVDFLSLNMQHRLACHFLSMTKTELWMIYTTVPLYNINILCMI